MKFIFRVFNTLIIIFVSFISIILLNGFYVYKNAIEEIPIEHKIDSIISNENYVKMEDISDYLKEYIVSVEDKRFYSHSGIDIKAILASFISNISVGYYKYGGSTITQQLAKNMYFSNKKSLTRKVAEMFVSFDIERNYVKDEILELYLNIIYFGNGYYGINDASYGYFNISPKELSQYQSSLLVGVPQGPSIYNLNDNKTMNKRYKEVLTILVKNNKITQDKANEFLDMYKTS